MSPEHKEYKHVERNFDGNNYYYAGFYSVAKIAERFVFDYVNRLQRFWEFVRYQQSGI